MKTRPMSIVVFAASATLACALTAFAGQGRSPVTGFGATQLNPDFTADGSGSITIGDVTYDVDIHVVADVVNQLVRGKSIHAPARHEFSVGGTLLLATSDMEILVPTSEPGVYRVNCRSVIAEGGVGNLTFHGTVNMVTGGVAFSIRGAVCLD